MRRPERVTVPAGGRPQHPGAAAGPGGLFSRTRSRRGGDLCIFQRMIARRMLLTGSLVFGTLLACARAQEPLPPAEEALLVVDSTGAALEIVPVQSPATATVIPLGAINATPSGVSALNGWALVPLGAADAVAVIDLQTRSLVRTIQLAANSGATGSAIVDDSIAYVANPGLNTVTRVNYLTGDTTTSLSVGRYPQAAVYTRGRLFVLNGNLPATTPPGPSWISIVDPVTNRLATGIDSILLPGPGNARSGTVAIDGVLYVMSSGPDDGVSEGRLTLIDPVGRRELGSFVGFGAAPGSVATNGTDRLYLSSYDEGLMVFDLLNRTLIRGAGNGAPIPTNSSVAVDSHGRIYALEAGLCVGGPGKVHVLRRNLSESRLLNVGGCPVAAIVTEIPPP